MDQNFHLVLNPKTNAKLEKYLALVSSLGAQTMPERLVACPRVNRELVEYISIFCPF